MTTQPQTVTIAQARASGASGLLVLDTAANIAAALPNPSLVSRVASFTVSAPSLLTFPQMSALVTLGSKLHAAAGALQLTGACTLTVAQLAGLEALPGFTVSQTGNITLSDTTTQIVGMLAAHPAWFAQLTTITIQLDGSSIGAYPATQLNGLITHGKTLVFVPTPGHTTLNIAAAAHDLATNAASLDALETHQALTFAVSNDGSAISATDAASLLTLVGFNPAAHTLTVSDTGTNLSPRIGGLLGHGFGQILVTSGTLAGTAAQLLDPTVHYAAGSHAQLAGSATVGTATAISLASLPGFSTSTGSVLTVADTAANLLATSPAWLTVASAAALSSDATISAQNAIGLAQIGAALAGNFSLAGHSLMVADSFGALVSLPTQAESLAAGFQLTADATASASQFQTFRALPNVSAAGHAITVADTAANLLALTGGLGLVHATTLSADASVTAAQLMALTTLPGFSAAGHALALSDTAFNLLALSPAALSQATSTSLSADATCTAQQAQALFADPGFTTGGHQLLITDTATNLLGLPHGIQVAATLLSLSANQTVTASTLSQLTSLGIKFAENGHALTCQDTAANLAALTAPALALAGAEVLGMTATVNAATAALLAALPNFSAAQGASLTVQDSVSNLIALGQAAPAAATLELLPAGTTVTISAGQAVALAALPHFSTAGAQITIADTVANLTAAGANVLSAIGGSVDVIDSAANLAAYAGTALVQTAAQDTLSGNAQISASVAAQLASIPHFSAGPYQLTVADTAAHIAARAAAIAPVATQVVVTDSGPVNAQAADTLATLSAAGVLSFQGGDQLLVQDGYAALTNNANAAGLALAARIGILDTAANLVAATAHNWGALNPSYTLSQAGAVSGAVATSLASLGSHFSNGGLNLTVSDTAAGVTAASNALATLSITAAVTDNAANVGTQAGALAGLGQAITSIHLTDTAAVSAAAAAQLANLAGVLAGPALQVADTAAHVDANLAGLATLQAHVAIQVTDSSTNVAAYASDLSSLGSQLVISLTDMSPVSAATAAALSPVQGSLAAGSAIAVSDTAADIAAHAATLAAMLPVIGQVSLTDGSTQSIATVAALAPLDNHLVAGLEFTAVGTPAAVAANLPALTRLNLDGRLQAVQVSGSTANVAAQLSALNSLPSQVAISDVAANVDSGLATLAQVNGLQSIALTDAGTPTLSMSVSTLASDASALTKITTPYTITLSDTASHIAADVSAGTASVIAVHLAQIGQIIANDGQSVVLSQAALVAPGIDDGPNSVLAKFTGSLTAANIDVAHIALVAGLNHAPSSMIVADTSANVAADLSQGNASAILAALPRLTAINSTDGQAVNLDAGVALNTHVDDSANSAVALLSGASFNVTNATVANLPSLLALQIPPSTVSVVDTAASIAADLSSAQPSLVQNISTLASITVSDGLTISLTEAQLTALHVDDGAGSVFSKISGGHLLTTNVAAGDIGAVLSLPVAPDDISITDTAAHVVSNLASELGNLSRISSINISGGPLTLSAAEALSSHVDDAAGSLIDLVAGHVFDVSGASVAQLTPLSLLPHAPASIAVSDTTGNIVGDLTSSNSILASNASLLGALTVSHGTLALTDAQAVAILGSPGLAAVLTHLLPATQVVVSGVSVADLSTVASSGWPHLAINVSDTTAHLTADLASQGSVLLGQQSVITGVSLTAGGTVDAASLASLASLANFQTNGVGLTLQDSVAATLALPAGTRSLAQSVAIDDSSVHVGVNLDALQAALSSPFSITLTDSSPAISVTAAQYQADRAVLQAITNPAVITVTDGAAALSPITSSLAADAGVTAVDVTDSAANVVGNLDMLLAAGAKLHVSLTDTSITANLVAPLLSIPTLNLSGLPVVDTGTQIAAVVEEGDAATLSYLNTYGASLSDSSPISVADASALESLSGFALNGHMLVVWDTAQHLTAATYAATLTNNMVGAICLKTSTGSVSVSASMAATLFALPGFTTSTPTGSANQLYVTDSAPRIDAVLGALTAYRSAIAGVVVNASGSVSDQVLTDLQTLNATAAAGVGLTVRDTAAAIASNAISQSSGQSLLPVGWVLSGNATVSEATAATLGSIPNFSAGGFTITISLSADTVISVPDANEIGNLAGSVNLNGHHLVVAGSAAQLATLSAPALQLVTPALIDTASNVAALPANSPLLHGSVEITGSDPLSASTVTALLNLIHSNGQGISPNALTIDATHTVTDSVANLRALVSSVSWAANASEQAGFQLVAQDSVATLANPANTAVLHSFSASTLSGDATVNASLATSLAAASAAIHFTRGGYHVIVADTVSNLLNPSNSAGLASADTILLSGPDHADAADAETLLSIPHFDLRVPLTVIDSSSNLLDGQLASVVQGSGFATHVQVQLAGPETLDAQTAADLVSLPSFSDTQDLTISDDPSYLLNAASLAAENMASVVTLASDEVVSTNTVLRLSELPHFTSGGFHLALASNDFANAATLKAVADMGSAFQANGHSVTMTSDALDLSPAEFTALQADNISHNGHQLGFIPTLVSVTDVGNVLSVAGAGLAGGTVRLYASDGTLLSTQTQAAGGFSVSTSDTGAGHAFSLTEAGPGAGAEGAPLVILDAAALEAEVAAAGASFASSGAIQVDTGKAVNLYTAGAVPNLLQPALVYDPTAHTLSLDIPGQSPIALLSLGSTTHPASLDASEIIFKVHG